MLELDRVRTIETLSQCGMCAEVRGRRDFLVGKLTLAVMRL
jgi:hypothetical protein